MVDAEAIEAEGPDGVGESVPKPMPVPDEAPEQVLAPLREAPAEVAGEGDPQEPQDPQEESLEPHQTILQGFWTVAQTLSAAYSSASSDIQHVVWRSLRESTTEDRTFIFGASNAICHWVESVRPAMACTEMGKGAKDHIQLLTDAREAGKEAIDAVLGLIPEEEPRLPRIFPKVDVKSVLSIAHHYTDEALQNIHAQLSDLVREHMTGPSSPEYSLTPSCRSPVHSGTRWMRWP